MELVLLATRTQSGKKCVVVCRSLDVEQCRSCSRVHSPHPSSQLRPHPSLDSQLSLVLGSSWHHGEDAVAFRAGYSCTTRIAPTSGSKGRRCNRRYSTRLLGSDPDSLHVATTCAPSHRIVFWGRFNGFFRRVVCAVERNSTQAHRSCLLVGPSAPL